MTQVCRECGCTNFSTCPGGCWWVEDDLCSRCQAAVDVTTGDSLTADELVGHWSPNAAGILVPAVTIVLDDPQTAAAIVSGLPQAGDGHGHTQAPGWTEPELREAYGG
jgi:hypothetical protein